MGLGAHAKRLYQAVHAMVPDDRRELRPLRCGHANTLDRDVDDFILSVDHPDEPAGLDPRRGPDPVAYILSTNIHRRHMTRGRRAMAVTSGGSVR